MRRPTASFLGTALMVAAASTASAQGPVIWENQFDLAGSADLARGVTINGDRAVAVGVGTTAENGINLLVRAYDVGTGALAWQDQAPLRSGIITTVAIDDVGRKVFGAGYAANGIGTAFFVRAYDSATGARLWEDTSADGADNYFQDIAAGRDAVFVAGYGGNTAGSAVKSIVRAYRKRDGKLLWQDRIGDGVNDAEAWQVETQAGLVFVASTVTTSNYRDIVLRAYEQATGRQLWETRYLDGSVTALAADVDHIYVGGSSVAGGVSGSLLAAYDLTTGNLAWANTPSGGAIRDVDARAGRVAAIGAGTSLVSVYNGDTGVALWAAQPAVNLDGSRDLPLSVSIGAGQVLIAGNSGVTFQYQEWLVRSYAVKTGQVLWDDRSHRDATSGAFDVTVGQGRAFAAGWGASPVGKMDFIVRAFSLVRRPTTTSSAVVEPAVEFEP